MTHRADSGNILKFLICALAVTVFGAVSNLIISFPLSLRAEKYGSQENNPERATATPESGCRCIRCELRPPELRPCSSWMVTRVTGGKLCSEIYRSEWLGALTALAAINLPLG